MAVPASAVRQEFCSNCTLRQGKEKAQITVGSQNSNRTFLYGVSIPLGENAEILYTSENGVRVVVLLAASAAVSGNLLFFVMFLLEIHIIMISLLEDFDQLM